MHLPTCLSTRVKMPPSTSPRRHMWGFAESERVHIVSPIGHVSDWTRVRFPRIIFVTIPCPTASHRSARGGSGQTRTLLSTRLQSQRKSQPESQRTKSTRTKTRFFRPKCVRPYRPSKLSGFVPRLSQTQQPMEHTMELPTNHYE